MKFNDFLTINKRILIIGTLIRIVFAPFTGHPYDLPIWMISGELIVKGISPYSPVDHLGQTVLWGVWAGIAYVMSWAIPCCEPYPYIFFIKILPISADIIAIYLIYKVLEEEGVNLTTEQIKNYSMLFLFNPVIIFGSAFWGMADSVAFCCTLQSYRVLNYNRLYLSASWFSISIALKLYPVILLPPLLFIIIFYKGGYRTAIKYAGFVILLFFVIAYLPFVFLSWDTGRISGVLFDQTQRQFGGMGTFGFFAISLESTLLRDTFSPINARLNKIYLLRWLWFLNSIVLSLIILWKYKHSLQPSNKQLKTYLELNLVYYCLWIIGATWVSEQNFIPLIGFLILYFAYLDVNQDNANKTTYKLFISTTGVVTIHIIFNVSLIMFFYLVYPNAESVHKNHIFNQFRANILAGMIVVSTILLLLIFNQTWNSFEKRSNEHLQVN